MKTGSVSLLLFFAIGIACVANGTEPIITLANVEPPPELEPDEPYAASFSLENAARYLDSAALTWQKSRACTACHTMMPYLMARPALNAILPQSGEVRTFFDEIASGRREPMPGYHNSDVAGAVAIGVASAMAINDRATGALLPLTRKALDKMWTLQRPGGDWEWPFRDTPPLKVNEHYGVTLAAVGAGMAPGDYTKTAAARTGLEAIRKYLGTHRAATLHQKAMTLWASVYVDRFLSESESAEILAVLMAAQRPDGGWSMASLVDNTEDPAIKASARAAKVRAEAGYGTDFLAYLGPDRVYKSSLESDGYATGFAIYVARQAGVLSTDPRLKHGVRWLKTHQREGGQWFTHSQGPHNQHLISNAGTAYAILALEACEEIPRLRPDK
jgi:squalene-hopene/tetraprenyl-beta-curcumene cyclase